MAAKANKSKGAKKVRTAPDEEMSVAGTETVSASERELSASDAALIGSTVQTQKNQSVVDPGLNERIAKKNLSDIRLVLLALIVFGTFVRFLYPFYCNPLSNKFADMLRIYQVALDSRNSDIMSLFDLPVYQSYLSTLVGVTSDSAWAIAIATGLLSAVTPWLWYRWMREAIPGKQLALAGWAILALLPSWLRIYGYFLPETVALPLTGLALWLSWRAARKGTYASYALSAVCWGVDCITQYVAVPLAVIVCAWLARKALTKYGASKGRTIGALLFMIVVGIYMIEPARLFSRTHIESLVPAELINRLYYQSAQKTFSFDCRYNDNKNGGIVTGTWNLECPSTLVPVFSPASDWQTFRKGQYKTYIDFTKDADDYCPNPRMSLGKRFQSTLENVIFFFMAPTWPADKFNSDELESLLVSVRWIWLPLTAAVCALSWRRRRLDIMTVLCLGAMACYVLQQAIMIEGRYRILWEGVAVAAFLSLLATAGGEKLPLTWTSARRPVISACLIVYIYAMTLWLLVPSPRRDALLRPIEPAILYTGLWQAWTMFSPDPRSVNLDLDAIITYEDGSTEKWIFPRVEQYSLLERVPKERYRKYGYDHLNWDAEKELWPDFAGWVARTHCTGGKKPKQIKLERHFAYIPPPEEGLGKPAPPHSDYYLFFTYDVKPEDLK